MTETIKYSDVDLNASGAFLYYGDVNEAETKSLTEFVMRQNLFKQHEKLRVYINSYGGELASGFAGADVVMASSIPVTTYGLGSVFSSGFLLFLSGTERVVTKNTIIMSHQYFGVNFGKHHDLMATVKGNELAYENMVTYVKERTGTDEDWIRKTLLGSSDRYISPEEALEYNIATRIADLT